MTPMDDVLVPCPPVVAWTFQGDSLIPVCATVVIVFEPGKDYDAAREQEDAARSRGAET